MEMWLWFSFCAAAGGGGTAAALEYIFGFFFYYLNPKTDCPTSWRETEKHPCKMKA